MDKEKIKGKMQEAMDFLNNEFSSLRTNRATPSLVENIKVDYYGTKTPLVQLTSISIPEAKIILIQPWDRNCLKEVEKAIAASDLGLSPVNEGSQIRLIIPPMTEERRKELVKITRQKAEEARLKLRNIREEEMKTLKRQKNEGALAEDDFYRNEEELQKIIDEYNEKVKKSALEKENEIMTI